MQIEFDQEEYIEQMKIIEQLRELQERKETLQAKINEMASATKNIRNYLQRSREELKKYNILSRISAKKRKEIAAIKKSINKDEKDLEAHYKKINNINEQIDRLQRQIEELEKSKKEKIFTFLSTMNKLQKRYNEAIQNGEIFILNEEDLKYGIDNTGKEIRTIDDLVMVHKTSFFPYGAIKTSYETGRQETEEVTLKVDGEEKKFSYTERSYRNTVHFCLNGSVESHAYGSWDDKKYAIFMPLAFNKDKIVAGTECDLFSEGSIPINKTAYILCPKEEIAKMKEANPEAHIIGYEGNSVGPYAEIFLSQILGYKYKKPQNLSRNWGNGNNGKPSKDSQTAKDIIIENGWEYISHNGSRWNQEEKMRMFTNRLCEKINIILNNNILFNEENILQVRKLIYSAIKSADMLSSYNFLSSLSNTELFPKISNEILNTTGINISTHITDKELANDDLADKLTDSIIRQLRIKALEKKQKQKPESLTEKEKIQIHYANEFGNLEEALFENIFTKEQLYIMEKYQPLLDREVNSLSEEELQTVIKVQNIKLELLSKDVKANGHIYTFLSSNITTEEKSKEQKENGYYVPVDERKLILNFKSPDTTEILSRLSGVNIKLLWEQMSTLEISELDKYYELDKKSSDFSAFHSIYYDGQQIETDFDCSNCKTVRELSDRLMQYARLYERLYNGENVSFNKYGEIDTSQPEVQDNNEQVKTAYEQAQAEFESLTEEERKKMTEDQRSQEEFQQSSSHTR